MTLAVIAGCALFGALVGFGWDSIEPWLIRGVEERSEQPDWTRPLTTRPVAALVGAIVCGLVGWNFGARVTLVPSLLLAAVLVGVTVTDLRYRIIPHKITGPLYLIGLALAAAIHPHRLLEVGLAGLVIGTITLTIALIVPAGGFGIGDVTLLTAMGAFLGWGIFRAFIVGILLSSLPAFVLLFKHGWGKRRSTYFALGPYLAAGALITLLTNDHLLTR